MSDDLHANTFAPYIGTEFTTPVRDGDPVALTLAAVEAAPEQPHAPRPDPFNLMFTAAAAFPQGTYELRHETLGTLVLFLVPREPLADGVPRYEATFN